MNFWQLMVAECKAILADKAIVVTLFGGVLFYSVLYPLPYLHQVPTEQQIVVVDHDNSSLSRLVTRHADASAKIKVLANVNSIDQAQAWIDAGKAHGLLVIPADFRRNLLLGKGATLSYGGDASYFLIYSAIVEGLVSAGIDASKHVQMIGLLARGQNPELAQQAVNSIHINSVPAFNPSLGYTPYVVPGLFLLILHQTLLIGTGILGAGQWGKQGYWQQVRPVTLVLARLSVFMMIYALFSSFYLGACFYWYKVSVVASVIEVGLFMLPFLLATGSLGIYLSSLFRRRELPTQLYLLVSMPILFVAGFVWPIALIPQPLVVASQVIPAVPAIMGMLELNQLGAGWSAVLPKWLQLWGLFAIFVTMAIVAIARKQQDVNTPS
ncbi:ABC transporter permease [Shewanella sp. SR43-4]|uniref:ABC transporter permease n=1 Tax=Shewanella TaxID=22 RepID=UPI000C602722|nr:MULTISPECIES: ABC transporter permease [Shewanella]NCQ45091.1 ABC transporter permease [Shewanella frigidimarina]MBB1316475.1 ABC transporter permease [Shewanella sp. SR43-4]NCO70921.1 ABC transporter permease [Shewanella vesiculosa]NCP37038.1 ABC transporter permease [Shewanella vesiculosa]NCP68869.1 ABC transporter permease [Shewanella vesiculosa]